MLFTLSCSNRDLEYVEKVMEGNPVMADSILNTIPVPESLRSLALYSLLKTQIDYKLYRTFNTDSIIRIATDFYGTSRKSYRAAMAWYSLGCVAGEMNDGVTAAGAYQKAISLFPDTLVRYYALAEQNLGNIYVNFGMYDEALTTLQSCRHNAVRLDDSAAIVFCDMNIAQVKLENKDFEGARALFNEIKDFSYTPGTHCRCYFKLAQILIVHDGNYRKALEYINHVIDCIDSVTDYGACLSIKADAYCGLGMTDSATYYYNLSLENTSDPYTCCCSYRELAELHSISGNNELARYCTVRANEWVDSIIYLDKDMQAFRSMLEQSEMSHQFRIRKLVSVFIPLLAIACIVFLTVYRRRKKAFATEIGKLSSELETQVKTRLKENVGTMEDFCSNYYDCQEQNERIKSQRIKSLVSDTIANITLKENVEKLTFLLNRSYNGIMDRISSCGVSLSENDIAIIMFSIAGCSVRSISVLTGIIVKTVYQKRARILERIGKSDPALKEEIEKLIKSK